MNYKQTVIIKNVSLSQANKTFNDIKFLKYLITLQPVKIIRWDGTYDGAKAHMKFWFFGWKDFVVTHGENKQSDSSFSFKVPENLIGKAFEIIFYTINGLEVLRKKTIVGDKIKVDFAKAKLSSGLYLLHAKTGVENFYFKVTYLR